MYYKQINKGVILNIGRIQNVQIGMVEITEENYNTLMATIQAKPQDSVEQVYELSAETETYIARETNHDEKVQWYFNAVSSEEMTLEEVPEEYQEEVEALIPNEMDNPMYAAGYEQALLDLMEDDDEAEESDE